MQTRETLQLLFEKWIKKLRLTPDRDIHLEWVEDPAWRKTADFKIDCDDRKAIILLNAAEIDRENMEEMIVHELMHLKLYPLDQITESLIVSNFEEGTQGYDFAYRCFTISSLLTHILGTQGYDFAYRCFFTALEQTVEEPAKCFLLEFGQNKELSFQRCSTTKSFTELYEGLKPIE